MANTELNISIWCYDSMQSELEKKCSNVKCKYHIKNRTNLNQPFETLPLKDTEECLETAIDFLDEEEVENE